MSDSMNAQNAQITQNANAVSSEVANAVSSEVANAVSSETVPQVVPEQVVVAPEQVHHEQVPSETVPNAVPRAVPNVNEQAVPNANEQAVPEQAVPNAVSEIPNEEFAAVENVEDYYKFIKKHMDKLREKDIPAVYEVLRKGSEAAREVAAKTMDEVRKAMKINYFDDISLINEQAQRFAAE